MTKNILKKATQYHFEPEDYDFIIELCKVGHVYTLSRQVTVIAEKGFSFKEYGDDRKQHVPGLILPKGWAIEGIYQHHDGVKITLGKIKE